MVKTHRFFRQRQTTTAFLWLLASSSLCQSFIPSHAPRARTAKTCIFSSSSTLIRPWPDEQTTIPASTASHSAHPWDNDSGSRRGTLRDLLQSGNLERAVVELYRMTAPTTADYNLVLTGYAQAGRVTEAESLVQHMVDQCHRHSTASANTTAGGGDLCALPNRHTYYQLLDALLQSGQGPAAERAEEILHAVIENFGSAGTVAYNKVLKICKHEIERDLATSSTAAERAERLFAAMLERNIADRISYTTMIAIKASQGDAVTANEMADHMLSLADPNLQPNTQTWNTVLYGWVRRGKLERAEQVLRRMEQLGRNHGTMKPDVVSYSTLLDGWAKSRDDNGLIKMTSLFHRMKSLDCTPNFWTHVTLLHAYAKRGDPRQAQDLLFDMYHAAAHGDRPDLQPNTKLVTAVMDAWQRTGQGAEQAESLLNWMIQVGEQHRDLAPNEYSFSSAISAWSKSRSVGRVIRARQVLNRMLELHQQGRFNLAHPNTVCYTAVINCCAYSQNCDDADKQTALRIAIQTFRELEKSPHARPNEVTYSNLLTAIRNLLPASHSRSAAIQDIFHSAVAKGYCDPLVVHRLKSALSKDEILNLLPASLSKSDGLVSMDMIPSDWCRHVKK